MHQRVGAATDLNQLKAHLRLRAIRRHTQPQVLAITRHAPDGGVLAFRQVHVLPARWRECAGHRLVDALLGAVVEAGLLLAGGRLVDIPAEIMHAPFADLRPARFGGFELRIRQLLLDQTLVRVDRDLGWQLHVLRKAQIGVGQRGEGNCSSS